MTTGMSTEEHKMNQQSPRGLVYNHTGVVGVYKYHFTRFDGILLLCVGEEIKVGSTVSVEGITFQVEKFNGEEKILKRIEDSLDYV